MGTLKDDCIHEGPPSYENWRAYLDGAASSVTEEYPLYTDARITGELPDGFGPYQFFNTVPGVGNKRVVAPAIYLRESWHLVQKRPDFSKTDEGCYHGGWIVDEVAALCSLALGVRVKAGPCRRIFDLHGDPLGRPIFWYYKEEPSISFGGRGPVIPRITQEHSLSLLEPLKQFPKLTATDATAVIRAARLYQDSLWICESEPALAWVMLVSALETGADQHDKKKYKPIEILEMAKPNLYRKITEIGDEELTDIVLHEIADTIRATKKFMNFVLEFLPHQPQKRPPDWGQHPWDTGSLKKTLSKIYGYRSRALHGGIPFPAPMCEPPYFQTDWEAPFEKPIGGASYTLGGVWLANDTPLLLHTFEYIVRGCLLNWFSSLTATSNQEDAPDQEPVR